jgi:hypothetical protein
MLGPQMDGQPSHCLRKQILIEVFAQVTTSGVLIIIIELGCGSVILALHHLTIGKVVAGHVITSFILRGRVTFVTAMGKKGLDDVLWRLLEDDRWLLKTIVERFRIIVVCCFLRKREILVYL